MDPIDRIALLFSESIQTKQQALAVIAPAIARAAEALSSALDDGHKALCCGNGGSAADAQHFSSEMLNRYERQRPGLPMLALTTDTSILTSIANDDDFAAVFARQVLALGNQDDILFAISTSGDSENILRAIEAAHVRGMQVIALTGREGGRAAGLLQDRDIMICVPGTSTARIQEVHLLIIHCLCDIVETQLPGKET